MTIEEEMMQRPRRRRMDGFSDDGLSYSVASDFDKMLGQAMAEYEARSNAPRFVPGARVESPDAPDLLRQELLDPVFSAANALQGRSVRPQAAEPALRTVKRGSDVLMLDPRSGEIVQEFKADVKPDNAARKFKLDILGRQIQGLSELQYNPAKAAMAGLNPEQIQAQIGNLNAEAEKILAGEDIIQQGLPTPAAVAPAAVAPTPTPQIFMGDKSGGINIGAAPEYSANRAAAKEVTRTLRDGRKAIFDADTKKFIRYAD